MRSRTTDLLKSMDLFAELGDQELARVARLLREQKFAENELIFSQGDAGEDGLYIVSQGRVRIATTDQFGRERVLAFYGPGEFFGDMAVLTGAPRSATAMASSEVRLLQLRKDDFDNLVSTNVGLMRGMLQVMVARQTAMNTRVSQESGAGAADVRGLLTVVFSPRGGTGQTTLATNLAVALAQATPDRVALLDLDLLFGHVAMLLDLVPRTALSALSPSAIRNLDRESLAHYMSRHAESSLRVMVSTVRPEDSDLVTGDHVRAVLDQFRRQYVQGVVDVGSRFSDACVAALEMADRVLVVCTPDPAGLNAARESQRVMRDLLGVPADRVRYLVNHSSPYAAASRTEVAAALGSEGLVEVPFGGEDVGRAALEGFPLVMSRASNGVSRAVASLAQDLERAGREALALSAR